MARKRHVLVEQLASILDSTPTKSTYLEVELERLREEMARESDPTVYAFYRGVEFTYRWMLDRLFRGSPLAWVRWIRARNTDPSIVILTDKPDA